MSEYERCMTNRASVYMRLRELQSRGLTFDEASDIIFEVNHVKPKWSLWRNLLRALGLETKCIDDL